MASNFWKKLFKRETPVSVEQSETSEHIFVEKYVLAKPNNMMVDYTWFFDCRAIPVAYEPENSGGFNDCLTLPNTFAVRRYLTQLMNTDNKRLSDPRTRTVSIVKMTHDKHVLVYPELNRNIPSARIAPFYGKKQNEEERDSWVLYVTPEINRVIVNQIKTITR